MFTTLFSFPLFAVLIQSVLAQDYSGFVIYTPDFVQCQSAQISWSDPNYHPPYDLLIVSAQDVCGEALEDLGNQTSTSMNFTVNLAAGTQVILSLLDAADNEAWSGVITVAGSNDTSCLTSPSSASPSSTSALPSSTSTHPSTTFAVSKIAPTSSGSFPTSSTSSPSGTAGGGQASASAALLTRRLSAVTLLGSAMLAVVAFTF